MGVLPVESGIFFNVFLCEVRVVRIGRGIGGGWVGWRRLGFFLSEIHHRLRRKGFGFDASTMESE